MSQIQFEEIWTCLEQDNRAAGLGYPQRRINPDKAYDLFLAVEKPSNKRMLVIRLRSMVPDLPDGDLPSSKGFETRLIQNSNHTELQVVLSNIQYRDIFTLLVQDSVTIMSSIERDDKATLVLISRLRQWQSFLQKNRVDGLDENNRRGLFGELWFLRRFLAETLPHEEAIRSWQGPYGTNQDYQFPGCAVEVKTSVANQLQVLRISNERQLDNTGTNQLMVFHLSLDERQGGGETLPQLVGDVRRIFNKVPMIFELLQNCLFNAGYLDIHENLYVQTGYTVRSYNFFLVRDNFPRIVESELRNGVGEVRYSISVPECLHYRIENQEAINLILSGAKREA